MPNRGAELSISQKELIVNVQFSEEGASGSKIAELLQLNRFTILKFLNRFKSSESVENKQNRVRRVAWCRTKLHMTVKNYWRKVIFTDETQIVLGKDRKIYVWRKDNETWLPRCLGKHSDPNPHVRASVMFGGALHTTV